MPQVICTHCQTVFYVRPVQLRRGEGKYCSYACRGAAQHAVHQATGTVARACLNCNATFQVSASYASETRGLYCSRACANAFRRRPIDVRFWEKVDKTTDTDGCWLWTGARDRDGYGLFNATQAKQEMAHRVAYRLLYGEFDAALKILHHCDNPSCCRPDHLFVGTNSDNMHDMVTKGRSLTGERHPRAKLTDDDVRTIREAYASRMVTLNDLAQQYDVSTNHISNIVRGLVRNLAT